ncbi:MAG: InlB B-repeat-containing protein, partial [Clostridia bacterium]|nr:InlB B-repeat-containing protein [Clostridia bacterium]
TTGAHTVIKGGNICAMGGDIFSVMINDDVTGGDMVIEKDACFYAEKGIDATPVNGAGERVYPVLIDNPDNLRIFVDFKEYPFTTSPGRTDACVYLTHGYHDIRVGSGKNIYVDNPEIGASVLEKQYGDFTVINPNNDPNAVSYFSGVLSVKKSTPITIKNTNPAIATRDRISILPRTDANITLAGVNINDNISSPISISRGNDDAGNVTITLAKDTENTVYGTDAGIELDGKNGSLTIEGEGTLIASGSRNSAAIGSRKNKAVSNITINGGTIYARHSDFGSGAAAIGSGKIEAGASINSGYAVNNITINGGTVYANSDFAPAVGAGVCEQKLPVNSITVNGGMLIADSNYGEYTIGGEETKEVVINGGVITAKSSTEGKGGIAASKTVIENMASVKTTRVTGPVNGNGKSVSLNTVTVNEEKNVIIDGAPFPYTSHNGENKVYIYLAKDQKTDYTPRINVIESERGTVTYSPKAPKAGDKVTLNVWENEGYSFGKFTLSPEIEIDEDNSFIMPDESVTIGAEFNRIGTITVKDCVNGTVIPSKTSAPSGETITLCVIPDEGMVLSGLTVSPESTVLTGRKFVMPEEDNTVSCTCVPGDYTVTWNVNGKKTTDTVKFGAPITVPEDPEIDGYTFIGWTPAVAEAMPGEDVEYTAEFAADSYIAEFTADSKTVAKVPYTMGDKAIKEPAVPEKVGYTGKWEEYTLTAGGISVEAVYTPIEYSARFIANGELVDTVAYTMETLSLDEPDVPEKAGYTGVWSDYTLTVGGITVKAVYTPAVHEHTFAAKYSYNETAHWYAALCGHDVVLGLAVHTFGDGVAEGNITKYTCTECGYVKTVTGTQEDIAKALASAKTAAGNAIDSVAKDGSEDVEKYAARAKAEIAKLTDISEVNVQLAAAIEEIISMKTEAAVADALAALDDVTASTDKSKSLVKEARLLLGKAESPEEVDAILADVLTKIEAAESAEAEITEAKTAAKEAIAEKAGEKQSDEMKGIIADVYAVIDAAQTAEQAAAAKKLGEASVQTQLDKEAADASLAEARAEAAELTEKLNKANDDLNKSKADLEKIKDEKAELEKQLKELKDKADAQKTEIASLNEQIAAKDAQITAKENEINSLKAEAESYEKTISDLKAQIKSTEETINSLNAQLNDAKKEIERLKEQGGDPGTGNICSKCGKVHANDLWGKIACFFNRIGNWFRNLFK